MCFLFHYVTGTRPGTRNWNPPAPGSASPSPSVAEAAADAALPRSDRLRLAPEYIAATADDYAQLARTQDWRRALGQMRTAALAGGTAELSLLDVGCGAGAFTAALAASGALTDDPDDDTGMNTVPVRVDLLDPSPSALRAATASLAPPLTLGQLRCATVQDYAAALAAGESGPSGGGDVSSVSSVASASGAGVPSKQYDVVLVIHTLSSVAPGLVPHHPNAGLAAALRAIRALLRPGGFGFIAIATADSHYARFHALYHREFGRGSSLAAAAAARGGCGFGGVESSGGVLCTTAEHVVAALSARGVTHNRADHAHVTAVSCDDRRRLEAYLHGRAVGTTLRSDHIPNQRSAAQCRILFSLLPFSVYDRVRR